MDWLKLFTLLVAVASVPITADGPKKKIRIHLPQKVKHIHHHKKIYITNHPAHSQYAPAYLPNAEGSVAVPNVAMSAMANIVPLNSVELYDEAPGRMPGVAPAATHLLPLYHTRGYYGPTHTEIDEQDYDVVPGAESEESYGPTGYSAPVAASPSRPPKRIKIIKVNEPPRKKVIRKGKPKRVVRKKPQPPPQSEEEHPVSSFHEQFYSDIDGSGTIRKIRKPPRVEKIVDGDTEHIHTYSEEHIHKMLYDDRPKVANVISIDPLTGIPGMAGGQHLIPFKNGQTIIAVPTNSFASLTPVGSLGNPTHFEYAAYNPREVTHDHIFHDHGEIPAEVEINKEAIGVPPKVSYNSQGLRVSGALNRPKPKTSARAKKPKPTPVDLSYYEGIYVSNGKQKKVQQPRLPLLNYQTPDEANFRTIPDFGYRENNVKARIPATTYYGKASNDYRLQQSSPPAPFSVSSTIVHDYKPKSYAGVGAPAGSLTNIKDLYGNFKDTYANNFEYDSFASSSNLHTSEDKNDYSYETHGKKGKKKSISTQNISFGGKDHISLIDHLNFEDNTDTGEPTALENVDQFDDHSLVDLATPSPFTLKASSPAHQYYSSMAVKAFHDDPLSLPEASNDNFEYVEAPTPSTTPFVPSVATTMHTPVHYAIKNIDTTTEIPNYIIDSRQHNRERENSKNSNKNKNENERHSMKESFPTLSELRAKSMNNPEHYLQHQETNPTTVRSKLKYGDKI